MWLFRFPLICPAEQGAFASFGWRVVVGVDGAGVEVGASCVAVADGLVVAGGTLVAVRGAMVEVGWTATGWGAAAGVAVVEAARLGAAGAVELRVPLARKAAPLTESTINPASPARP